MRGEIERCLTELEQAQVAEAEPVGNVERLGEQMRTEGDPE
jgi:hypothetical protein